MKPSYEGSARALAGRGIGRVSRWRLFGEARSCRIVRSFRCWSERIFRTMEQRTRITMHVFTAVLVPSESSPTRIAREQSHSPVIASVRGMKTSREEGRERQRTLDAAMSRRVARIAFTLERTPSGSPSSASFQRRRGLAVHASHSNPGIRLHSLALRAV